MVWELRFLVFLMSVFKFSLEGLKPLFFFFARFRTSWPTEAVVSLNL